MKKQLKFFAIKRFAIPIWAKNVVNTLKQSYNEHFPEAVPKPFGLIIDDIKLLKLGAFRRCVVEGDLTALIMTGEALPEDLDNAFMNILSQFYEVKKDKAIGDFINTKVAIVKKKLHIERIEQLVAVMRITPDASVINELKADGYNYPFTEASMDKDLQAIITGEKKHVREYNRLLRYFNENYEKKGNKLMSDEDFMSQVDVIRQFANYKESPVAMLESITVYDYGLAWASYYKHIEYLESLNHKKNVPVSR